MFRRILVPLDGTALGEHALPYALSLARRSGATVDLIHVHVAEADATDVEGITPYRYERVLEREHELDRARFGDEAEHLVTLAELLSSEEGLDVVAHVLRGDVAPMIRHHAERSAADLVVMTRSLGEPGTGRPMGVSAALVRNARTPLLLVHPRGDAPPRMDPPLRHMLVGLDGSALAEQVLGPVASLLALVDGRATLVRTVPTPERTVAAARGGGDEYLKARYGEAEAYLHEVAPRFTGPTAVRVFVSDHPAAALLEAARAEQADIIAMATHGRSGLGRAVLGSVTAEVLKRSGLPVLVVHARPVSRLAAPIAEALRVPRVY